MKKVICFALILFIFLASAISNENLSQKIEQRKVGISKEVKLEQERIGLEREEMREKMKNLFVQTRLELEEEINETHYKLMAQLSNGRNAEIKIMPNVASERALERLRLKVCSEENNCTIELKEVAQNRNQNETRLAYEIKAEKRARIFGLFRVKMKVQSQVDAETGEIIFSKKPWWSFLASESE